jgi:glycosyltransferase involved in cell wall biosynthesis
MDETSLQRPNWLDDFESINARPLRVLHVGNIANNAFINAKLMRKIGIHADIVCADYYHMMGTPEWEEAEFAGDYGDPFFPDWWRVIRGYQRPHWFFQGPKRLCQEALCAQFESSDTGDKSWAKLLLSTHYISYRDSKSAKPGGGLNVVQRLKRRVDFLSYLLKFGFRFPGVAWDGLLEIAPWLSVFKVIGTSIALFTALLIVSLLGVLERLGYFLTGRKGQFGWQWALRASQLKWKFQYLMREKLLRPLIPSGSKLFRALTGRNFSEVFGWSPNQRLSGRSTPRKVESLPSQGLEGVEAELTPKYELSDAERAHTLSIYRKYLSLIHGSVLWGGVHQTWHEKITPAEYSSDIILANALTAGWDEVYRHYDVIQCYSVDGIVPMALGIKHFFNYEHGTLRAIPFENTPIGRLTATAYKRCTRVMMTNLDNYSSCERLKIPDNHIVPLPHAMDDEKIFKFIAARPNIKPSGHDAPLFFSSARQHWLDKDPNYAKGNDVFFRAAAKAHQQGYNMRIMLVEWGRDLKESKVLLQELGISDLVTWVPTMTGEELWERYLECHAVVDQFVIPAFGRVTFDSLTIGRRVISNLDVKLAKRFFGVAPPMLVSESVEDAEQAIMTVLNDPEDKNGIGRASADWAKKCHSSQRILDLQLDAYRSSLVIEGKMSSNAIGRQL